MTNKKITRRALVMSVTSLLICISMLLGTTFAWFTDEVTSGVNKIVAGNLDVELYHKNAHNDEEAVVNTTTKLFMKDIDGNDLLWEPGVISFETFEVRNIGTLALKYALTLNNVGFNTVDGYALTEVIKVAVVDEAPATRAEAMGLTYDQTLGEFVNAANNTGNLPAATGTDPYTSESFTVVLYWEPTADDNNWNANNDKDTSDGEPLFVELGITLVATQDTVENDSFDDQYDVDAEQPTDPYAANRVSAAQTLSATSDAQIVSTTEETVFIAAATPSSSSGNTTVTFDADAVSETDKVVLNVSTKNILAAAATDEFAIASGDNAAVASIDLSLTKESDNTVVVTFDTSGEAEKKYAEIETYITKGLSNVVITYGNPATETWTSTSDEPYKLTYDPVTGKLTFKTCHFSSFIVYDNMEAYNATLDKVYSTLQGAINDAKSGNEIFLLKDVTVANSVKLDNDNTVYGIEITKSLIINGSGHTIYSNAQRAIGIKGKSETEKIDVVLKNLNIVTNEGKGPHSIFTRGNINSISMDNVIVDNTKATNNYNQAITIGGSNDAAAKIVIKDSEIKNASNVYYAMIIWHPVNLTITDSKIQGWANLYFKDGSDGSTVNINGGSLTSVGLDGTSNTFALINFESGNNNVTINNANISVTTTAEVSNQYLVGFSEWDGPNTGNTVNVSGGTIVVEGGNAALCDLPSIDLENSLIIKNATINGETNQSYTYTSPEPEGREVDLFTSQSNGFQILPVYCGYGTLSDLLEETFPDGFWIEFKQNVTLEGEHQITAADDATFGIVFGDYSLTLADEAKLVLPTNATIKTDKQVTDLFSAPSGYKVTETEVEGSYFYTVTVDEQSGE